MRNTRPRHLLIEETTTDSPLMSLYREMAETMRSLKSYSRRYMVKTDFMEYLRAVPEFQDYSRRSTWEQSMQYLVNDPSVDRSDLITAKIASMSLRPDAEASCAESARKIFKKTVDVVNSLGKDLTAEESSLAADIIRAIRKYSSDAEFINYVSGAFRSSPGGDVNLGAVMINISNKDSSVESDESVEKIKTAVTALYRLKSPQNVSKYVEAARFQIADRDRIESQLTSPEMRSFASDILELARPYFDVKIDPTSREALQAAFSSAFKGSQELMMSYEAENLFLAVLADKGFNDFRLRSRTDRDPTHMLRKIFNSAYGQTGPGSATEDVVNRMKSALKAWDERLDDLSKVPPEVNPPDRKDPTFGKYVFAPERHEEVPYEENTEEEKLVFKALNRHVNDNAPFGSKEAELLKRVVRDNEYPAFFRSPDQEYVFRGMEVHKDTLEKLLGEKPQTDTGAKDVDMTVRVRGGRDQSMSWTTDWKVARSFSKAENRLPDRFSVVLVARVSDNPGSFIIGDDGFYKVPAIKSFAHEKETIGLGPIKIVKVYWASGSDKIGSFDAGSDVKEGSMNTTGLLRRLIREVMMNEIDIADVGDVCYTAGSTHVMKTCKIGGNKYFLKFSDEDLFEDTDPSLQVLIEYLAYRIYALYSGIKIPSPELVYDAPGRRVGIATTPAKGKQALVMRMDPRKLGKMMSQGVYVDIFLANWDVVGTGSGNVFVDNDEVTRIDPGGSLTFRAQGGRKGSKFSPKAGELRHMMNPERGAGEYFQHADLKVAAREFLAVPWSDIQSEIDSVKNEVAEELETRGMDSLLDQWNDDVDLIKSTLSSRHREIESHAREILSK